MSHLQRGRVRFTYVVTKGLAPRDEEKKKWRK